MRQEKYLWLAGSVGQELRMSAQPRQQVQRLASQGSEPRRQKSTDEMETKV
jgi:hypothetical protein